MKINNEPTLTHLVYELEELNLKVKSCQISSEEFTVKEKELLVKISSIIKQKAFSGQVLLNDKPTINLMITN